MTGKRNFISALIVLIPFCFIQVQVKQTQEFTPYYYDKSSMFQVLPDTPGEIIFLGDSITDRCEWVELLGNVNIKNRGLSGDQTEGILNRLNEILSSHPDKIFIMIGINDLRHGKSVEEILTNYKKIIERITSESENTRLFIQSVLPVNNSVKHNKITNDKVMELNAELALLSADKGIAFIDLSNIMCDDAGELNENYTSDGLHLNGSAYLLWGEKIKSYVAGKAND